MSDRLTRPTVRLAGGLPDGALSNLEALGGRMLSDAPPDVYALVLVTRHKREENDDQDGAELAICKVRALEALPLDWTDRFGAARFPFAIEAGELVADVLQRMRADRTGDAVLPVATDREAASHDAAMMALRDWAAANLDEGVNALAEQWNDYFGDRSPAGTVTAWRDAPTQMLREFLSAKGEQSDAEPVAEPDDQPGPQEVTAAEMLDRDPEPDTYEHPEPEPDQPGLRSVPAASFSGDQS